MKGLFAALAVAVAGLLLWFRRPRWSPAEARPYTWHTCARCSALVRPAEIMCAEHWCQVPVSIRVALRAELVGSLMWIRLADKAVEWSEL